MRFLVFLHGDGNGYGISFPDLPGCVSDGDSLAETLARGGKALAFHVEGMAEDGHSRPPPRTVAEIMADPSLTAWRDGAELAWVSPALPWRNRTRTTRLFA